MERLVADRNTSRKVVWRSRIVLLSAEGCGTMAIMRRSGTSKPTVWRWQARYLEAGVDGLLRDKSRPPGRAPLDPAIKTLVLTKTMRETPPDATHWSVRSMARAVGIRHQPHQRPEYVSTSAGQGAGRRRQYGLKPHLVDTFKVSNDPAFAEKVADVVGLYQTRLGDPPGPSQTPPRGLHGAGARGSVIRHPFPHLQQQERSFRSTRRARFRPSTAPNPACP